MKIEHLLVLNQWWKLRPPRANSHLHCWRKQVQLGFIEKTKFEKISVLKTEKYHRGRRKEDRKMARQLRAHRRTKTRRTEDVDGDHENRLSRRSTERCWGRLGFDFLTLFSISYYNSIWKLLMFLHYNLYIYKSNYEGKTGFDFFLVLRRQRLV